MLMKFMYQNVHFTLEYEKSQAFRLPKAEKNQQQQKHRIKSLLVSNIIEKYFN